VRPATRLPLIRPDRYLMIRGMITIVMTIMGGVQGGTPVGTSAPDGCFLQLFRPVFSPAGLCPSCWQIGIPLEIETDGRHFDAPMNAAECARAARNAGATAWYANLRVALCIHLCPKLEFRSRARCM